MKYGFLKVNLKLLKMWSEIQGFIDTIWAKVEHISAAMAVVASILKFLGLEEKFKNYVAKKINKLSVRATARFRK